MGPVFECYQEIIPEYTDFKDSLGKPFPVHFRINRLKAEPVRLVRELLKKGLKIRESLRGNRDFFSIENLTTPGNLFEYFMGYIHPQALTSCLASLALGPLEDSYVLDMCASPGGKTAHMAELMNNSGLMVANELYTGRLVSLGNTIDRLGVLNTVITGYQAQQFPPKEPFDFILADVPCSGEGRFRKINDDSRYREDAKKKHLPELQKKIITKGFDLLKTGGEMLYSTCTYNPAENEEVVDFLLKTRDAKLLPINVGVHYEQGLEQWKDRKYDSRLILSARFYPHRIDSVGFFMARIGKP